MTARERRDDRGGARSGRGQRRGHGRGDAGSAGSDSGRKGTFSAGASGAGRDRAPGREDPREGGGGRPGSAGGAPSRTRAGAPPPLPAQRPELPTDVYRDVKGTTGPDVREDVLRALTAAEAALEQGDVQRAVDVLDWARQVAPRSWAVREALGVARYLQGDYGAAQRELQTYRRLTGSQDQNHLLADCARANGRLERAQAEVDAMMEAAVAEERVAEGLMVLAGALRDRGDLHGALAQLRRGRFERADPALHHLRMAFLASELAEQQGEVAEAARLRAAIAAVDADLLDAFDAAK